MAKKGEVYPVQITPAIKLEVSFEEVMFGSIYDHQENTKKMIERGVTPLSFEDIMSQIDQDEVAAMVLFDTVPFGAEPGNHWRVTNYAQDEKELTLQFCSPTGAVDQKAPTFTISSKELFFSGLSIRYITGVSSRLTAHEYGLLHQQLTPEERNEYSDQETIYWSSGLAAQLEKPEMFRYISPLLNIAMIQHEEPSLH